MFVDRISPDGFLEGRWFERAGRLCAILPRTPVPAAERDALEVGVFALEVEGREVGRVYGSLEAATRHFLALLGEA